MVKSQLLELLQSQEQGMEERAEIPLNVCAPEGGRISPVRAERSG